MTTRTQRMKTAFARVVDPVNWKRPIDAEIALEVDGELDLIVDAIRRYARAETVIYPLGRNRFRIVSPGYYATLIAQQDDHYATRPPVYT